MPPPEVLNLIIEMYTDDHKTLYSCSLVCKSWLQATRYHIFGDLVLHLGGAYEATFLALLRHPLCTFSASVRKIWILPAQERDLSKQVNENLTQLSKLTGVRTLRIHRQKIIPPQTLSVLATTFKDVTTLLVAIRFPALSDAIQFACSFPRLETLHFEPVRTPPGEFPSVDIYMPSHLQTLHLNTMRSHERWFAEHRVPSLSTLSVDHIRPLDDIARLDNMLEIFGIDLRRLTLRFDAQKGDFEVRVNLSHNTQLQYLEIDLTGLTRKHVLPAISSIRAPNVEIIVWRSRRAFEFPAEMWNGLDVLLSDRDSFPMLMILPPALCNTISNTTTCLLLNPQASSTSAGVTLSRAASNSARVEEARTCSTLFEKTNARESKVLTQGFDTSCDLAVAESDPRRRERPGTWLPESS
ncbi:hypothetical protein GGX14DRAFT_626178 [Mycena pura]|uniref:F-box domain-containing protein n=1 Tax=Mycena pura TaxID=153505 RepID=A0AAD6YHP7_9AGAR|nr:hypothetical protein GGX14DRAFT_626178 [Mycena pura]